MNISLCLAYSPAIAAETNNAGGWWLCATSSSIMVCPPSKPPAHAACMVELSIAVHAAMGTPSSMVLCTHPPADGDARSKGHHAPHA